MTSNPEAMDQDRHKGNRNHIVLEYALHSVPLLYFFIPATVLQCLNYGFILILSFMQAGSLCFVFSLNYCCSYFALSYNFYFHENTCQNIY